MLIPEAHGGAAFPQDNDAIGSPGMSLRDYFAAKALQGICAHNDTWGLPTNGHIANAAYTLADAMLAERAK